MRKNGYIIIEGNIGVGKSTFGAALTRAIQALGLRAEFIEEPADGSNPYLPLYYADPKRYAYEMQAHLLSKRYAATQYAQWGAQSGHGWFVLDRSYYGDVCFARVQRKDGFFDDIAYRSYISMHHAMETQIHAPTAAMFLEAAPDALIRRIARRMSEKAGRACECAISREYLESLQAEIDALRDFMACRTRCLCLDWRADRSRRDIDAAAADIAADVVGSGRDSDYSPWGSFLDDPVTP